MDGWMDGRMDGRTDGWMDGSCNCYIGVLKNSSTPGALENKVRLIILRTLKTYPVKFFAFT